MQSNSCSNSDFIVATRVAELAPRISFTGFPPWNSQHLMIRQTVYDYLLRSYTPMQTQVGSLCPRNTRRSEILSEFTVAKVSLSSFASTFTFLRKLAILRHGPHQPEYTSTTDIIIQQYWVEYSTMRRRMVVICLFHLTNESILPQENFPLRLSLDF